MMGERFMKKLMQRVIKNFETLCPDVEFTWDFKKGEYLQLTAQSLHPLGPEEISEIEDIVDMKLKTTHDKNDYIEYIFHQTKEEYLS